MILLTGGAGFIGSAYLWHLNLLGESRVVVCDRFRGGEKWRNLRGLDYLDFVFPEDLPGFLDRHGSEIRTVVHLGAISATTETDMDLLWRNNVEFSKDLFRRAAALRQTFVYASSAATYGDGEKGYDDDESKNATLRPLNKYGYSKWLFDEWVLRQSDRPSRWAGLKFFNVYGPNEFHKGSMASVVKHAWEQIRSTGRAKLFKSHREGIGDGEQKRDFVYVKDAVRMIDHFRVVPSPGGLYNVATGEARTFRDFVTAIFTALGVPPAIDFIDMPEALRGKYQYYTRGPVDKIRSVGYAAPVAPLEESVRDYVLNHLRNEDPFLSRP